jgi:hypothetical protein
MTIIEYEYAARYRARVDGGGDCHGVGQLRRCERHPRAS